MMNIPYWSENKVIDNKVVASGWILDIPKI